MKSLLRFLFVLREYFFPADCALCGKSLLDADECWYGLCRSCRDGCMAIEEKRCRRCGRPLISEEGDCLSCRERGEGDCGRIFTLFPYTGKYRKLLAAYKFGKSRGLGHFLAEKLLAFFATLPPEDREALGKAVWVPVPPRPGKIRATGWDQVEYLARLLEAPWEPGGLVTGRFPQKPPLGVRRCLRRLPSQSQKKLGREDRKTNLRGRIRCVKPPPEEAILLDDLVTTGSTLEACAAALKEGGAQRVWGFCLFYD